MRLDSRWIVGKTVEAIDVERVVIEGEEHKHLREIRFTDGSALRFNVNEAEIAAGGDSYLITPLYVRRK